MDKHIAVMETAARAGGDILRGYFGQKKLDIVEKTIVSDFQTKADTESEAAIIRVLREAYPAYNVNAEETGLVDNGSEYTFYVDPLDGSNNFVLGIPYFAVGIALQHRNETVAAIIHDPMVPRTYTTVRGAGAFSDSKPIHVNKEGEVHRVTATYIPSYQHPRPFSSALYTQMHTHYGTKRVLSNWSPCLDFALLAEGAIEVCMVNGIESYDFLPGKLMLREAGARITDWNGVDDSGDTNNRFVVTNGTDIHGTFIEIIQKCLPALSK